MIKSINQEKLDKFVEEVFCYDPITGNITNKISRKQSPKGKIIGVLLTQGYLQIKIKGMKFYAQRIAWRLHYGKWPNGTLDHINGIKTDNRIQNLREVSKRENDQNKHYHRKGKLVGAIFNKSLGKFRPIIQHNYKTFIIGIYDNAIDANKYYMKACKAFEVREFSTAQELREYIKNNM